MTERIIFVDENDTVIGAGDRNEAHKHGYYTRNIRVVLRDSRGRILSQKRTMAKDTYPGMWTVAAGGHVDEGESWETAAARETKEEIGIDVDLKLVGEFTFKDDNDGKKVRQIIRVYEGKVDADTQFTLQLEEVDEIAWYTQQELIDQMHSLPEKFTPSFHETIQRFYSL